MTPGAGRALATARAVRTGEATLMLGFPVLAGVLAMPPGRVMPPPQLLGILLAAAPLSLSIYAHNTLAGRDTDRSDPKFDANPLHRGTVDRTTLAAVTWAGALTGFAVLAALAPAALPWTFGLWVLWLAYSHPRGLKGRPGVATLLHVVAGALIFTIPYTGVRPLDVRGTLLALFFGLVLASGHANHEAIDEPADRAAGVRTLAVASGRRTAVLLNLVLATGAYGVLAAGLAADRIEAAIALPFLTAGTLHVISGCLWLRGTPGTAVLRRYRTGYRLLFAAAALIASALHVAGAGGAGP